MLLRVSVLLLLFFGVCVANHAQVNNNTSTDEGLSMDFAVPRRDTQPKGLTRYADFDNFLKNTFAYDPPAISCKELHERLQKEEERVFILDARDAHEYNISHLPGARRIGWSDFSTERVWMYDREALVVVYCSIGERSVRMAAFLRRMGFKNVRILYGSITEWANQGYELVDQSDKNTRRVFFTDKTYAKFLRHGSSVFDRI